MKPKIQNSDECLRQFEVPETVEIAGVVYTVEEVPVVELGGDKNYQGSITFRTTNIQLLEELSNERKHQVLIHEITHGLFYEAGYEDPEEDMISSVGKALYQFIMDNDLSIYRR